MRSAPQAWALPAPARRLYWIVLSIDGANSDCQRCWLGERTASREFGEYLEGLARQGIAFDFAFLYDRDPLECDAVAIAYARAR